MAKPAPPNDPDDVLDSIRRLVMHDAKGGGTGTRGRAVAASPPDIDSVRSRGTPSFQPWSASVPGAADTAKAKLLLTQDFMIDETQEADRPSAPTPTEEVEQDEIVKARDEISAFLRSQTTAPTAEPAPAPAAKPDQDPVAAAREALRARNRKPAPVPDPVPAPDAAVDDPTAAAPPPVAPAPAPTDADLRARVESAVLDTLKSVGDAPLAPAPEFQIDEDALREMVADIVKRELQGALGERITRNVRKLVRREIYRALEARNLD